MAARSLAAVVALIRGHLDLSPRTLALAACTHPEAPSAMASHCADPGWLPHDGEGYPARSRSGE
ncbi:hypothetical protein [Gordonia sp. CPCC 205333]|uniref:hypothetical protein n=1 Tax=Gordonia sp. CPCC 205333 TaxID=3140790 RepID=UPI003AF3D742